MESHRLGLEGEVIARQHAEQLGYKVLCTNYYCRYGELDIVALHRGAIVFIEVKSRSRSNGFEQAIGPKKKKSLLLSARSFMQRNGLQSRNFRFVACFVCFPEGKSGPSFLHWLEDPF